MAHVTDATGKSVLLVASNPATSPVTGWPIGFWWAELTHPWLTFRDAGYSVTIASPDGGTLHGDGYSDPEDASGYSADDIISLGFKSSPACRALLEDTPRLDSLDLAQFDAIMVVGGQGPMVTFYENEALHQIFASFIAAGKPGCAICHGTCILLKARGSDGELLVKGKTWTGFANAEERFAESAAGQKIQPFWIEDEAGAIGDTNFITAAAFSSFALRDGLLITGQQQNSGVAAARLVIEALGK